MENKHERVKTQRIQRGSVTLSSTGTYKAKEFSIKHLLGWMKHKLESGLPGKISITSDMQMTPPLWQKAKKN